MDIEGFLIVFEGIDGSGKTTQSKMLENVLRLSNVDCIWTFEPTRGEYGQKLRESFTSKRLSPDDELELFVKDRQEHCDKLIAPSLKEGKIVICDRYFMSNMAYQGARGISVEEILKMNSFAPKPDLWFYIETPIDICIKRILERSKKTNNFEKKEYLEKVDNIFKNLNVDGKRIIDNNRSIIDVQQEIIDEVFHLLYFDKYCYRSSSLYKCEPEFCTYSSTGKCKFLDKMNDANDFLKSM